MTDITELAQSHELLIANGQQTADLLRHLADNEIDSDYFAVVSECESYGKETDAELSITEFALRAAGYVDELVEALEKAQGMEAYWKTQCRGITDHCEELQARIAELESRSVNIKFAPIPVEELGNVRDGKKHPYMFGAGYNSAVIHCESVIQQELDAKGIKWEAE
ncbi:TPA: hypothetical protein ACIJTY_000379 [Klebsiella oxytoca]